MSKLATALVTAHSTSRGVILLEIAQCPFCGRKHTHGGGTDPSHLDLGWRAPHCLDGSLGDNYYLFDDVQVPWAEAKRIVEAARKGVRR